MHANVDANIIIRYILEDDETFFKKAQAIIDHENIFISGEVILEVVYVLTKVYNIPRKEISKNLTDLLLYPNISLDNLDVVIGALDCFAKMNLDYVECYLFSMSKIKKVTVHTFDKKLEKTLKTLI